MVAFEYGENGSWQKPMEAKFDYSVNGLESSDHSCQRLSLSNNYPCDENLLPLLLSLTF